MNDFKNLEFNEIELKNLEGVSQHDLIANTNLKIDKLVKSIRDLFTEGMVSDKGIFDLFASVKYLHNKLEELTKDQQIRSTVIGELGKFNNNYESNKYKISMRRYGKYDYSKTGHPAIDLEIYIAEVMNAFVESSKDIAKKLSESSNIKNNVVALLKSDIISLRDNINVAFDTLLDMYDENQEVMNIKVNPASFKGEEVPTLSFKKQK